MKKFTLITVLTVIGIMFASCSTGSTFHAKEFIVEAVGINTFNIDVIDREVVVKPSTNNKIYIQCFENDKEYYSLSKSDGTLNLTYVHNKEWYEFFGYKKPNKENRIITIKIPQNVLNSLNITTTNEPIVLQETSVLQNLVINNNNGDIRLNNVNAGTSITLTNKNGDIKGSIKGGYDDYAIKVEIKKGNSNLSSKSGGPKNLVIDNNNGDIAITLNK